MALDDAHSKVLLHFNGADGSTVFTDESGKTWTPDGGIYYNPEIDTAQSVFGGASGYFDSVMDRISTPWHADFALGNSDWTIDFRLRFSSITHRAIIQIGETSGSTITVTYYNSAPTGLRVAFGAVTSAFAWAPVAATWYHVAIVHDNSAETIKVYIDGTLLSSQSNTQHPSISSGSSFIGHCPGPNNGLAGWLDELRISDLQRWTANFTPPTAEYQPVTEIIVEVPVTELLLTAHAPLIIPVKVGVTGLEIQAFSPSCGILLPAPASGLILTGHAPSLAMAVNIPLTGLSLAAPTFHAGYVLAIEAKSLVLSAPAPGLAMGVPMPVAGLEIASFNPQYRWDIPAAERTVAQGIYLCYLTGENESLPLEDLLIKISSFQSRLRDGDPSYVSVVVPSAGDYVDDILARQNGEIVIKKGYRLSDGTIMAEEIARVAFETLQTFEGAHSYSAILNGHATTSSSSPAYRTVTGLSYIGRLVSGKTTIRADMDLFLRIGDVCIYGDEAAERFTVGQISYTVGPYQAIMQVTEA